MCGRFALGLPPKSIAEQFQLDFVPDMKLRYNIAPTQEVASIVHDKNTNKHLLKMFRWGLIPHWAKDIKIGAKLINARSETVADKPAFRSAFSYRRCLIPATGFYEWERKKQTKQPYYIKMRDDQLFAFAGLWERWKGEEEEINSCTILTTEANEVIKMIHDRMPVILKHEDYDTWIDTDIIYEKRLELLLSPYPPEQMDIYPISTYVNKPQNDDPKCIQPI